ncbi:MAG TPA: phenylalanine--tRNA ligase subunit beta [Gemmatimonadaceae bacterium]|jgi:phenylalanyl-tRNA synthetase beta chain|nr:phenylalanine--tRNA ligase subunit beta [Gemmatimonadaceae bacterium]
MKYSHEWLRAFVPHSLTPDEARELMTKHVATVDAMQQLRGELSNIVVARVIEAGRHPNSDHLWLTMVDDGSGTLLAVVCGAPNVSVGALYPFARTGVTLPNGVTIEQRKIRGITSNGMLCSARELALGEDQAGIMELRVSAEPGTRLLDAMPLGDVLYEVDVLPNRADLLSHLGMARELTALTGVRWHVPQEVPKLPPVQKAISAPHEAHAANVRVAIHDLEGCPRYMGVVVRGVRVGPSPDWLVRRLAGIGLRSISNVVDITNYMLHGFGQPMHAFDLAKIGGNEVIIRKAYPDEIILTLDGIGRMLSPDMTVIADAERAVAIAGVIGGKDSEVTEATRDVFLEVAYFSPANTRRTRRALGLSTDASYRFERGIDPAVTPFALNLAAGLLVHVAGGRIDGAPVDVGGPPAPPPALSARASRIASLLGDNIPAAETERLLVSVGFGVQRAGTDRFTVTPPTWRSDVTRECDLAEEIARLRGYDRLPDTLRPQLPSAVPDHPLYRVSQRVRDRLVALGYYEAVPLPFVAGNDDTHLRVTNPLNESEPHLRTSILETLGPRAEHNMGRLQRDIRLFEVGAVFERRDGALPNEEIHAGALAMGLRQPPHFSEPNPPLIDEWDAKALALEIAEAAFPGATIEIAPQPAASQVLWEVRRDAQPIGAVRRLSLDKPVWAPDVYGVEVSLGRMANELIAPPGEHARGHAPNEAPPAALRTRPLPTTPPAEFDLALVVPDELPAASVEAVIARSGGELLERLQLFDLYQGEGLPPGSRSLAWRLTFRDPSRTLRDKEIEGRRQRIIKALDNELGVKPRSS